MFRTFRMFRTFQTRTLFRANTGGTYPAHGGVRFELGSWSRLAKFLPTVAGKIGLGGIPVSILYICLVSTADICPVSAAAT